MYPKPTMQKYSLTYPDHVFKPEDLLDFIETRVFTQAWKDMGLDDEDDLTALQLSIMTAPKANPVISGTGGLRKLRFAPPESQTGKRGSLRVCYVYFEEFHIILLVYVYPKSKQANLTEQQKRVIKNLIEEQKKELQRGPVS